MTNVHTCPTPTPHRDLEENAGLGSEVAGYTIVYFAYGSLYLTFCSLKTLQM